MRRRLYLIIPLLANGTLLAMLAEINHVLHWTHLTLCCAGLLGLFASLNLSFSLGLTINALSACLLATWERNLPIGFYLGFFISTHCLLYQLRLRFPRERNKQWVPLALLINLVFLLLSTVWLQVQPTQLSSPFIPAADNQTFQDSLLSVDNSKSLPHILPPVDLSTQAIRFFANCLASQILVFFIAKWFFHLQNSLLLWRGINLQAETLSE